MIKALAIVTAIIIALVPGFVAAHEATIFISTTCNRWSTDVWVYGDSPAPHRMIITENDKVVKVSIISNQGWTNLFHKTGALLSSKTIRVYIYDKVNGAYLYSPPLGSTFHPLTSIGKAGLVDFKIATARPYACSGFRGVRRG